MTARVRGWGLGLVLLGATACSLLVSFDPDGQPCGLEGACLAGYSCVDGRCRLGGPPLDPCSGCKPTERCNSAGTACEVRTCANTPCPFGDLCVVDDGGVPACAARQAPGPGQACELDSDCGTGGTRVCVRGARARALVDGGAGFGVCLDRCLSTGSCSNSATQVCTEFRSGLDAGIGRACLPAGLLTPCAAEADCVRISPDFTCALFAHPKTGLLQACDLADEGGVAQGQPCGLVPDAGTPDGGPVRCAGGACVAAGDGQSVCASTCSGAGCGQQGECRVVELALVGVAVRPSVCVQPTECAPCAANGECGADAPFCTAGADGGLGSACLISCTPLADGGAGLCPPGRACQDFGGTFRCIPEGTGCP